MKKETITEKIFGDNPITITFMLMQYMAISFYVTFLIINILQQI